MRLPARRLSLQDKTVKLARVLLTALLAMPEAGGPAVAQQPVATTVDAELVHSLSVIADGDVMMSRFMPMITAFRSDWGAEKTLKEIAALDAEVRDLFWIYFLRAETTSGEMHLFLTREAVARRKATALRADLIASGKGAAEADAYLERLLFSGGNPAQHAPAVAEALSRSGLARQHRAFVAAQALAAEDPEADFSGLNAEFGTPADLQEAIEAYRARTPAIAAWIAQVRHALSDDARLWHLRRELEDLTDDDVERLPKPLRIIHCVDRFNLHMVTASFSPFFHKLTGDHAPETVAAMRAMGLKRHADALQRGMDMIGQPYPTDWPTREKLWNNINTDDLDEELVRLTVDIEESEITPALLSLAKRQGLLPR